MALRIRQPLVALPVVISGTLSQTLGAITLSATGKLDIQGTLGGTLGGITLAATGKLDIAGQAAITLGAITASATGKVDISGTLGSTLGQITLSATGALAISGQLARTLGPVTLVATGLFGGTAGSYITPAMRIVLRNGEDMVLRRGGEVSTIAIKGKRIQGSVEFTGNSAMQQQFRVKITPVEIQASGWASRFPKPSDTLQIDGRWRALLDVRPLSGVRGRLELYELTVAG